MRSSSKSINVLEDAAGLAELRRLGARSVPVLSRGDDFVFAQNIAHVVKFLGLNEKTGPVLSPAQLVARLELFLDAAERFIPQMPDDAPERRGAEPAAHLSRAGPPHVPHRGDLP